MLPDAPAGKRPQKGSWGPPTWSVGFSSGRGLFGGGRKQRIDVSPTPQFQGSAIHFTARRFDPPIASERRRPAIRRGLRFQIGGAEMAGHKGQNHGRSSEADRQCSPSIWLSKSAISALTRSSVSGSNRCPRKRRECEIFSRIFSHCSHMGLTANWAGANALSVIDSCQGWSDDDSNHIASVRFPTLVDLV